MGKGIAQHLATFIYDVEEAGGSRQRNIHAELSFEVPCRIDNNFAPCPEFIDSLEDYCKGIADKVKEKHL